MSAAPPPRIFLIDDHGTWLRALRRVLVQAGAEVRAFEEPEPLLEALEDELPELVVIDFDLGPGGTGDRLAARLRETLRTACPPLVLLTAQLGDIGDRALVGFDAALSKDMKPDPLVAALLSHARAYRGAQSTLSRKARASDEAAAEKETGSG